MPLGLGGTPICIPMNYAQIKIWLTLLGEHEVEPGNPGEWCNTHCPLAAWDHERGTDSNPSFGLKNEPGDSRCYCFACGFTGGQTMLLFQLRDRLRGQVHSINFKRAMQLIVEAEEGAEGLAIEEWRDNDRPEPDSVFDEDWLHGFEPAYRNDMVHPYLAERGMPYVTAAAWDLRYMVGEERVCFPVRNWAGDLVGLHGRTVVPGVEPTYRVIKCRDMKNPLAWLGEDKVDTEKPVVFTESVFDLARVHQVYRNVMCPLTASMSKAKIQRVSRCLHIVTYFDDDQAGNVARRKIKQGLHDRPVEHLIPEEQDPGDMTARQVAKQLEGLVDLDPLLL